jgi:hypothetical protein
MNKTIYVLLFCLLAVPGQGRAEEPQSQTTVGKFVVVPAGNPLPGADKSAGRFAAWRLNTETGDVDLCLYDSGAVGGGGVTAESLRCIPENRTAKPRVK